MTDEYLRLAYHGLRAKDKSFNATMKTSYDANIGNIKYYSTGCWAINFKFDNERIYAVTEKKKAADIAEPKVSYEPTVSITTRKIGGRIEIRVADNGNGDSTKSIGQNISTVFHHKTNGAGDWPGA